ncbi:hypothetical protein [Pseudoalteromonas sp.]|jgi:hypothetical protein|nr:hypothetical protein [Pseudoalteromonas sp.]
MKKLIDFKGLESSIQEHADLFFDGNFSMAVRSLVRKGLIGG